MLPPLRIASLFVCVFLILTSHLSANDWLVGGDISALPFFEQHGAVYYDEEGNSGDCIALLQEKGSNCFRLRLFVDPTMEEVVCNDLDYTLRLAKRIKNAGASLLLDLHYSDTWADPAKQFIPACWEGMDEDQLATAVEAYTEEVFKRFIEEGITVDYVQLGNEITNGFLWPIGRIEHNPEDAEDYTNWDQFAGLLHAAHRGLESAYAGSGQKLPVRYHHIESADDPNKTLWYLKGLARYDIPFDGIALSYYPEWHGTLNDLQVAMALVVSMTHKPVLVVETAYPWCEEEGVEATDENFPYGKSQEGQSAFLEALVETVKSAPDGKGSGVIYWYPESRRMDADFYIWKWGSYALFDEHGRILKGAEFAKSQ